jgi:cytochrome P450/NAD(P)-dependent dehydrogenase (short-subunit alcohol dehydrogenase family)
MKSGSYDFTGRVGIVTGGGNGLGKSIAMELAARGAAMVVNDLGTAPNGCGASHNTASLVCGDIIDAGGRAVASFDSVATRSGGEALVRIALEHFGRVDFLVSNAGILRNGRFDVMSDEDIDGVLETHLKAGFYVGQAAYRAMVKQHYGRLVFMSSGVGLFGLPYQANYAAAKGGLAALSNVLALEGARYGIRSNAVLPVAMTRLADAMGPEFSDYPAPDLTTLMDKLTPEFVTPLVVYLASESCSSTHGLYSAVGGRYARVFVGVTPGWQGDAAQPPRPEDIELHLAVIEDRSEFSVPMTHFEELEYIMERRSSGGLDSEGPLAAVPAHVPRSLVRDFDFTNPGKSLGGAVHTAWSAVRHPAGLFWTPRNGGHWIMTRGAFIREALQDYERFSSKESVVPRGVWPVPVIPQETDPPQHRDYRQIMNLALAPNVVGQLREATHQHCKGLLDQLAPQGKCEFMGEFARVLPMRVFVRLLNLPAADGERLLALTQDVSKSADLRVRQEALHSLMDYVERRLEERTDGAGHDLFGRILEARVDGGRKLSREEKLGLATQALFGGLDTVASVLGFSMEYLAQHPTQRRQLTQDSAAIGRGVDELLRRFSIAIPARIVADDCTFHGVTLRRGEYVQLPTFMHGLDPEEFADPLSVDFTRQNATSQLAFGQGHHRCPGASLAKVEITAALTEWLARIPDFRVSEAGRERHSAGLVLGVRELPLEWQTVESR